MMKPFLSFILTALLFTFPFVTFAKVEIEQGALDSPLTRQLSGSSHWNSQMPNRQCPWVLSAQQKTIRNALEQWAIRAGWQPYWELSADFPIELSASFCGTFPEAVESVLKSLSASGTPVRGLFYRGNKVLRFVSGAS